MTLTLGALNIEPYVEADGGVEKINNLVVVEHEFPGTNSSKFQNMGGRANEWQVIGVISGSSMDIDASTLQGYYDNQTTVSFVYNTTQNVKVTELSLRQMAVHWIFEMTLREV